MTGPPVFVPDATAAEAASMAEFRRSCADRLGVALKDYAAMQDWALREPDAFWRYFLEWSRLSWSGSADLALDGREVESARFFPNVRLNYATNLLDGGHDDALIALSAYGEEGLRMRLTRKDLRARVETLSRQLVRLGCNPGDRIVALARNDETAVIACLAAASIGAVWSSVSTDLGADAVLSRFQQLAPAILVTHSRYTVQGATRDLRERIRSVTLGLPTLRAILALDDGLGPADVAIPLHRAELNATSSDVQGWPDVPFNHPLFILFSSGTTGPPKCIVHGTGGTLIEHVKEHRLHSDLRPGDRMYFHTTCGWMMWNWQLSALASGVEIVLFDGSVSYPERDSLLQMVDAAGVTHFGTSPAYLQFCRELALVPAKHLEFPRLRAIMSTGSLLPDSLYDWAASSLKAVSLQSISGGTDIIGCFVLGNPTLPVFRGESQCVSLGLDVQVEASGRREKVGTGELLCCQPFPSRPIGFFGDDDGHRFHEAYFSQNPGAWTHGDIIELTPRGTARVLGRSDGVLNVRGVRIGPAEISQIVLEHSAVRQAMAIEQPDPREPGGSRIVLLVVLAAGAALDRPLVLQLKREISTRASANHVPRVIADVSGLPTTFSGKLSERAATDALRGVPVANIGALRNPEVLAEIAAHAAVQVAK